MRTCTLSLAVGLALGAGFAVAADPIQVGNARQLFLDRQLVSETKGIRFQLHHPEPREIVLSHDVANEGNATCYATILDLGGKYRMYYNGSHYTQYDAIGTAREAHADLTCIAESADGLTWTRPVVGEVEFKGSKANNIIPVPARWTHCFTPFVDTNPKCKAGERFKAFAFDHGTPHALFGFVSSDGIHWTLVQDVPLLTDGNFDSQNLGFYDEVRECYVAYYRKPFANGKRGIATATSTDFLHWAEHGLISCTDEASLYTNAIMRYPRAPQFLLGFPMLFEDYRTYPGNYGAGVGDGGLLIGRDGSSFTLWPQAFFRPGPNRERWYNRCNYAANGFIRTPGSFPGSHEELSFYYSEGYSEGREVKLRRCVLRMDGFVSASADGEEGTLLTQPLVFARTPEGRICEAPESGMFKPLTIDKTEAVMHFGEKVLRVSRPIALEMPETQDLGQEVTFSVHVDAISRGGERRLFSTTDKQSGANRLCFHLYLAADKSHYADSLLRFEFTGVGRAEFKGEPFEAKIAARRNHHFAATYDHGKIRLFMDGEQVAEGPADASDKPLASFHGNVRFGNDYLPNGVFNSPFIGYADDVMILRRVLSPSQIATLAVSGAEKLVDLSRDRGVLYTFDRDTAVPVSDLLTSDGAQNGVFPDDVAWGDTMLLLNCATAARGHVKVEVLDASSGTAVPGFSADDCDLLFDDALERQVSWRGNADLTSLAGSPVRLRFKLKDADLYGFRFGQPEPAGGKRAGLVLSLTRNRGLRMR